MANPKLVDVIADLLGSDDVKVRRAPRTAPHNGYVAVEGAQHIHGSMCNGYIAQHTHQGALRPP